MTASTLTRPQLIALLVQHNVVTVSEGAALTESQLLAVLTGECLDHLRSVYDCPSYGEEDE